MFYQYLNPSAASFIHWLPGTAACTKSTVYELCMLWQQQSEDVVTEIMWSNKPEILTA
jgi:hypothetical protein